MCVVEHRQLAPSKIVSYQWDSAIKGLKDSALDKLEWLKHNAIHRQNSEALFMTVVAHRVPFDLLT